MSNEDKCNKIKECLGNTDILEILKVDNINHKPHCYTIGSKHVSYASKYYGGILDTKTLNKVKCAVSNCNLSYDEHTSDTVAFLQLKREVTKDEIQKLLKNIVDTIGETFISGFALVETEQKYRII